MKHDAHDALHKTAIEYNQLGTPLISAVVRSKQAFVLPLHLLDYPTTNTQSDNKPLDSLSLSQRVWHAQHMKDINNINNVNNIT